MNLNQCIRNFLILPGRIIFIAVMDMVAQGPNPPFKFYICITIPVLVGVCFFGFCSWENIYVMVLR